MKFFKIEFYHSWDITHFNNEKIITDLKHIVCNFSNIKCFIGCSDCNKETAKLQGRIRVKNYKPGLIYEGDIVYPNGRITVEMLIHCIDGYESDCRKLAEEIKSKLKHVISFEMTQNRTRFF